jgi:hypothetical protein
LRGLGPDTEPKGGNGLAWVPGGTLRMGRPTGLAIDLAAVVWLAFETVDIAWPRE